jgi:hypothetical protein
MDATQTGQAHTVRTLQPPAESVCITKENHHATANIVATMLDISHGSAHHTTLDILQLLQQYKTEGDHFLVHTVTSDNSWVHYLQPEMKMMSKERYHYSPPKASKKFHMQASVGKLVMMLLWEHHGPLSVHHLSKETTVTTVLYRTSLGFK